MTYSSKKQFFKQNVELMAANLQLFEAFDNKFEEKKEEKTNLKIIFLKKIFFLKFSFFAAVVKCDRSACANCGNTDYATALKWSEQGRYDLEETVVTSYDLNKLEKTT